MALSTAEEIQRMLEKKKILEAKIRKKRAKQATDERKARTHRLIQIGAIVEKWLSVDSEEKAQVLCETLVKDPRFDELIKTVSEVVADGSHENRETQETG